MGLQWLLCGQSPIGFFLPTCCFYEMSSVAAVASNTKKLLQSPHLSPGRSRKSLNFKSGSLRIFEPKELTDVEWLGFLCGGYLAGSPKTGPIQGTRSRFNWCVFSFQQSFLFITCIGDEKNKTHGFESVHPRWSANFGRSGFAFTLQISSSNIFSMKRFKRVVFVYFCLAHLLYWLKQFLKFF